MTAGHVSCLEHPGQWWGTTPNLLFSVYWESCHTVCRPLLLALTYIIFVSFELNIILYYCQLTSRPHAIISQKTIIFTGTTMRTSDLTKLSSHEPSVCGVLSYLLMRGQRAEIYEVCNWRWLVDSASPGLQAASSLQ